MWWPGMLLWRNNHDSLFLSAFVPVAFAILVISPSHPPREVGGAGFIITVVQLQRLRLQGATWLDPGHIARKWQSWNWSPGLLMVSGKYWGDKESPQPSVECVAFPRRTAWLWVPALPSPVVWPWAGYLRVSVPLPIYKMSKLIVPESPKAFWRSKWHIRERAKNNMRQVRDSNKCYIPNPQKSFPLRHDPKVSS